MVYLAKLFSVGEGRVEYGGFNRLYQSVRLRCPPEDELLVESGGSQGNQGFKPLYGYTWKSFYSNKLFSPI